MSMVMGVFALGNAPLRERRCAWGVVREVCHSHGGGGGLLDVDSHGSFASGDATLKEMRC